MPAAPFVDLSTIDLNHVEADQEKIYSFLPHRYEFMQLDRVVYMDKPNLLGVAVREVRPDEFWVRGHIPGRPLMPGVLMLETAAQFAAYYSYQILPETRFIGFGGVDEAKFRQTVVPPATLYLLLKGVDIRPRRVIADVQGWLENKLAFECRITGLPF